MDLSKLSVEDLQALKGGDLSKVSTAGLQELRGQPELPAPKDYDPVPASGVPQGFYAVTEDDGRQTLRHEAGLSDVTRALSDLPGVGLAERMGQGAIRLAGKAVSGLAGLVGGPDTVRSIQGTVNQATELPPSNDPTVRALGAVSDVAGKVAAPIDKAVSNLPPLLRGNVEVAEEAAPDIASILGARSALPSNSSAALIARSPEEVAQAAGYTGLRTKADLLAPGNQAITNALISRDAGIVPGQVPSVASLENARRVGPGRVYDATEQALPRTLTQDPELQAELQNLPQQVSQLPRSPDVEALQETMLSQPQMSRDELFANIREARERAKSHWKSDDPDKGALGDAYQSLADAYENFVGRQPGVDLPAWQQARVQMAKNYQAQSALRGEHFNAQAYGKLLERNPHLLTGDSAVVGHVANGLPAAASPGLADIASEATAITGGELAGHAVGVPGFGGGYAGHAIAAPAIRAQLRSLMTRGRPALAAQAPGNPALSYFYNQDRMPPGWNRALSSPLPSPFGGYLPSPDMINAGGGASTSNTLQNLGLTPDIQAAGRAHPAAARLAQLREQLSRPPMEELEPPRTQKWGDFSIAPEQPAAKPVEGIPFENVLEQGGTEKPPVGGIQTRYRPPAKAPAQPSIRTPPGEPALAAGPLPGPSPAQLAYRNKLQADRLRKLAGDLRMEGPGGATGSPADRARAALERQERGYADGGSVVARLARLVERLRPAATAEQAVRETTQGIPEQAVGKVFTPTGRQVPRDDEYERLQSLVTNQPTAPGTYQWQVVKPTGDVHGAPYDFKGSALRMADTLNRDTPGHTVEALSVDNPAISRYVPQPDPNANPFKKATAEDIAQQFGMAEGGEVPSSQPVGSSSPGSPGVSGALRDAIAALKDYVIDRPKRELQAEREDFENRFVDQSHYADGGSTDSSSLAQIADLARSAGISSQAENRARLATGIAKQFYGLDEHGNPVLGGRAWLSSQHGTPPGILDQLAALPAGAISLLNAISAGGPNIPGNADIPTPKWSTDAQARLDALNKRVAQVTGVHAPQTLPEHLIDAGASMVTPIPASGLAKDVPAARRALELLTPTRPQTLSRFGTDTALLGGANAGLDALIKRLGGESNAMGPQ